MSAELDIVTDPDPEPGATITFNDREFHVADRYGMMPLLRFAHLATRGVGIQDAAGFAAMYDLIRMVIAEDEWDAFCAHATETRASEEDLFAVSRQAIAVITARPTSRPSDSPDGPSSTPTNSPANSSSPESSTPPPAIDSPTSRRARRELRSVEDVSAGMSA